ncbi:GntR family transcriptional regulator [Rhodoferax sp.]|uniref:GntR family transcriptional regulator n=1 Tax=Rhodoferax sp. TaxID=50421 RepID=UPI00374CA49A
MRQQKSHEAGTEPPPSDAQMQKTLANLVNALDRCLPVPLGTQLRGLIEFGIALGELPSGQRLPSVREFAERAGIAPMTVSNVYRELRLSGLIETKPGAGTFVGDGHSSDGLHSSAMRKLQRRVDRLLDEAEALGMAPSLVASMVNARAARSRSSSRCLRILMVGNFLDTTQKYADRIREQLQPSDSIQATTVEALRAAPLSPFLFDLCVTLAHRRGEMEALLPAGVPVVGLSFIPSEETRSLLATIDPMARVGIVSVFPEFMAFMKPGVQRFTPHVSNTDIRLITAPDLPEFLQSLDVLVYASGAEHITKDLPAYRLAIEFQYVPDPHAILQTLLPAIEKLRTEIPKKE